MKANREPRPDSNCVFCKIVAGTIPAEKVYEDEHFLGILSIDPQGPGHTLIIPKAHYRWVWDVSADRTTSPNIAEYFEVVHRVAHAIRAAFKVELVRSKVVGEEVPHAHVWLYPNRETPGDLKDFKGNAEKIRQAMK